MTLQESPKPKKTNPTIWVILAILIILICCVLAVIAIGGAYIFTQRSGNLNRSLPGLPFLPTPGQKGPGLTPTVSNGPLVVEPFNPNSSVFPSLPDLVPNWSDATKPTSQDWSLTVPSNQPVLIYLGWCTSTSQVLQQNYQQIKWSLTVDGQPVDVQKLYLLNEQLSDRVCRSSVGVIRSWPGTQHKITTTMTVLQKINDGWNDYPAGDYTDVYNVAVAP